MVHCCLFATNEDNDPLDRVERFDQLDTNGMFQDTLLCTIRHMSYRARNHYRQTG